MKLTKSEMKKVKAAACRRKHKQVKVRIITEVYLLIKRNTQQVIRILRPRIVIL